jgi:hypothetical protein
MITSGGFWQVRDNQQTQRGSGPIERARLQNVDWAIVEGFYLGGMGQPVATVSQDQVVYADTGLVRVNFVNHPTAEITTVHHVLRTNRRPILDGPLAPIAGRPTTWHVNPNGGGEPLGFRYEWYVDGTEVVPYSTEHAFDHTFSSEGWHSVQVRILWANDAEQWETRHVYVGPDCGLDNCQFVRASPPPDALPDARSRFSKAARVLR